MKRSDYFELQHLIKNRIWEIEEDIKTWEDLKEKRESHNLTEPTKQAKIKLNELNCDLKKYNKLLTDFDSEFEDLLKNRT